jgi:hypothetical protein
VSRTRDCDLFLAQGSEAIFLLANGEFWFFLEAVKTIQILGAKQFKEERGHLREITEDFFYLAVETVILATLTHHKFVAEKRVSG